jgi:hypothetical protein
MQTLSSARARKRRPAGTARTWTDTLLLIGGTASMLLTVCLLAVVAANKLSNPIEVADTPSGPDAHGGKIVIHSPQGDGCLQRRFDNVTGRITEAGVLCGSPEFDGNGRPIVNGTVGRLNQIGKSFHDR